MRTAHLLSESGVDSHRLFSLFGIQLTEASVPLADPQCLISAPQTRGDLACRRTRQLEKEHGEIHRPQLLILDSVKPGEFWIHTLGWGVHFRHFRHPETGWNYILTEHWYQLKTETPLPYI